MKLSAIVLLLTLFALSEAVDYSLFKTCNQSSFCRRCRNVDTNRDRFSVLAQTLNYTANSVTVDVINNENQQLFLLKLEAIEDDMFRVEVDEKKPLRVRYRVKDALKGPPALGKITHVQTTHQEIVVTAASNKAVIKLSSLQIDFYRGSTLTVSANPIGLMYYEHLRRKSPNDKPGDWEESFNNFNDSKPYGPEAIALDFAFPQAEVLFGIPQHADSFILKPTLRGDPYRLYNLDVPGHVVNSPMALYGSIPVLYAHGRNATSGVFWHNAAETWVDIYNVSSDSRSLSQRKAIRGAHFMSESGIIDYFVLLGPKPLDAFKQYTKLTGTGNLPQLYTLAYHQCRWNYDNETDVDNVSKNFDKHDIPMDTMWLDIEYTNGKRYFTWDPKSFPRPLDMIRNLTNLGRHLVVIIDPHIKIDPNYYFHKDCSRLGYYTKNKNGKDYEGACWPGPSSYPDLTRQEVRKYFADQYLVFNGTTSDVMIWNDMNEPSVFEGPEKTMPKDNLHSFQWEHRNVHNLYGLYHTMATYDGLSRRDPKQRPFILTRSHFAGSQRYTAVWMGDNTADWPYLEASIKMCLSEAVAGMSFCGADVGGFFGDPDPELFERWYQAGAFQPFFRSHANQESKRREPWLFSESTKLIIREAIRKRYSYLPFWYTMFYEHERFGEPVMRPLLAHYPTDVHAFDIDQEYLLQDKLLVSPVMERGYQKFYVYFPKKEGSVGDLWYDIDFYTVYRNVGYQLVPLSNYSIPVFQRGGVIIPKKETIRRTSTLMKNDNYTLVICLDRAGAANGTLFVDDEKSHEFRRGNYLYISYEFSNGVLKNRFIDPNTKYAAVSKVDRILFAGLTKKPKTATLRVGSQSTTLNVSEQLNAIVLDKVGVNVTSLFNVTLNY